MPKPRVMIVEDDVLIAESTQLILGTLGYDVISTESTGPDAVKKAFLDTPDVILMDINLGGKMDGIQAASEIRSCSKIPIIFTTGYDDRRLINFPDTQSYFYLSKPFTPVELQVVIKAALSTAPRISLKKKRPAKTG